MQHPRIQELVDEQGYLRTAIGNSHDDIRNSFLHYLFFGLGRSPRYASLNDIYNSLALAVRDRVFYRFIDTLQTVARKDARVVAYLSAEYLPGPHLHNNLLNLRILQTTQEVMQELEIDLNALFEQEEEPGLGNGGLGRLASCYMDAMANLGVPSLAYGIRYEFGIFDQAIEQGWQREITDKWLRYGYPWEIERPEVAYEVKFGGKTRAYNDAGGRFRVDWQPEFVVRGTAHDTPILGYRGTCSLLRLWKAEAVESFDFDAFNQGDYYKAVEAKMISENITKVLYPNDQLLSGKELRLKQQFFFVSCALQDMIRLNSLQQRPLSRFHEKFVIQLNDTHPAISVAELMRLLLDEHLMSWDEAWQVTTQTFAFTNHTLLPEALEKWPLVLFERLLPRHLEIIYEINHRFLENLKYQYGYNDEQLAALSLIDETGERYIRMAHLAIVGSQKVNGVSALHSELLKTQVLQNFYKIWPEKFTNVTNGISQRRFLGVCNARLSELISSEIGDNWLVELNQLLRLEPLAEDKNFRKAWRDVKLANKTQLAAYFKQTLGIEVDPNSLFDVQAKRIHEYKRQHLKILHVLHLYLELKAGRLQDMPAQTFIFAGKAAPSYHMAKLIIRLIHAVGELVNHDKEINGLLKVVFMPDFNVKNAQRLYPAADLSEQISMAGKEASGTGNMKFSLNGALTLGTLDGANVEIREAVGEEHFFLFGLTTQEVMERKKHYEPQRIYEENSEIRQLLDFLVSGKLAGGDRELFRPIYDHLRYIDSYFLLADFTSYHQVHQQVLHVWKDQEEWSRHAILNVARMGRFSADRSIVDYCKRIWNIHALHEAEVAY